MNTYNAFPNNPSGLNSTPNNVPLFPATTPSTDRKKKWLLWGSVGVLAVLLLVIIAVIYGDFLGASLIGAKGGRIKVARGQQHTVVLPRNAQPKNIVLCYGKGTREQCQLLKGGAVGVLAKVLIPSQARLGNAVVKVQSVTSPTTLFYQRAVAIVRHVKQSVPISNGGGGGGSGGGGGGGGNGGGGGTPPNPYGGSTPTSTPPSPYGSTTPTPSSTPTLPY